MVTATVDAPQNSEAPSQGKDDKTKEAHEDLISGCSLCSIKISSCKIYSRFYFLRFSSVSDCRRWKDNSLRLSIVG